MSEGVSQSDFGTDTQVLPKSVVSSAVNWLVLGRGSPRIMPTPVDGSISMASRKIPGVSLW